MVDTRSKPHTISWPLNSQDIENLEMMLQELYDDLTLTSQTVTEIEETGGGGGGGSVSFPITPAQGGTGLTSYTIGDILYASAATTLAKLAIGTANHVLQVNTGATAPEWGLVNFDNMTPAASASTLIGRQSGSAGNWQAITLGTGLSMSGTTLSSTGGETHLDGYWSPLTNGDPVSPELIFDSFGDTIAVWTPTP